MLDWLAHTPYAEWVNESWGWPLALTGHAFGTATVVGVMFIIGLRLVGLFGPIPYAAMNKLMPVVWVAVAFQVMSGVTLWMTKPAQYLADVVFAVKLVFLVIAIVVTWQLHLSMAREAAAWQVKGRASSRGRKLAIAACLLWAAVLIGGRLTAYLGSLYPT
jgi:hypothetical protein